MKKIILMLSVMIAAIGFSAQARQRIVYQTVPEVICHECACGRDHFIETQRVVDRKASVNCAKNNGSAEVAAAAAGAIIGVAVATVGVACVLAVAVEATVFFGFVWLVAAIIGC